VVPVNCELPSVNPTVDKCWNGQTVRVTSMNPNVATTVSTAVSKWNELLLPVRNGPPVPQLRFVPSGVGEIQVNVASGPSSFCGLTQVEAMPVTISLFSSNSTNCTAGASRGSMYNVLLHELGHALGWTSVVHKLHVPGISDNCAMYLSDSSRALNSLVCLHDAEGIYRANNRTFDVSIFGKKIARRTDLDTTYIALAPGVSKSPLLTSVSSPRTVTYGVAFPIDDRRRVAWSSDVPTIATVDTSGTILAVGSGVT
jgi:hypothetical protein